MNQSRPAIAPSTGSSGLFTSLHSADSYFRELGKRSSRPKVSDRSSDSFRASSPKTIHSPRPRSSSPAVSNYSLDSVSQRGSANDVVDEPSAYISLNSQSFANEGVPTHTAGDPPRPPKPGYEWVWYPDPYGYWAERPEIPRNATGISKNWPKWKRISFASKASTSSFEKLQTNTERKQSNAERKQSNAERRQSNAERRQSNSARRQSNATRGQSNTERRNSIKASQQDISTSHGLETDDKMEDAATSLTQGSIQQKFLKSFQFLSPKINSPMGEGEVLPKSKTGKPPQIYEQNLSSTSGSDNSALSRTAVILKGVAEVLEHHDGQDSDCSRPTIDRQLSNHRKRVFHRHGRNSQDSVMSLTDSIRSILRGRTPVVTPATGEKYTASDGKQYLKVDLGVKNAPTYLPSEATRIHTPPLSDESSGIPARGFFFDLSPPDNYDTINLWESRCIPKPAVSPGPQGRQFGLGSRSPSTRIPESPTTPGSRNRIAKLRIMWEHGFHTGAKKQETKAPRFELDVPEHLPSSPLCPMNPKHKSGGTGICVYHGRKKKGSDASTVQG